MNDEEPAFDLRVGIIRYQHIGPIMDRDVPMILARLREAERAS